MKKQIWQRQHKWLGIILTFFILMFAISGIILNHPKMVKEIDVSRKYLPQSYHYQHFNLGLIRGTIPYHSYTMMYGNNGIWVTNKYTHNIKPFSKGLPKGADNQQIRRIIKTKRNCFIALSTYNIYLLDTLKQQWVPLTTLKQNDVKLSDIETKGDSIIITSRSNIYVATYPYKHFQKITLRAPLNYQHKVSLFRTIWLLHSGELFGSIGKLLVDIIAIALIILCITGIVYWLIPHIPLKRYTKTKGFILKKTWFHHNRIGKISIVFTLFLCITGWMLRPPALIAIATAKIHPIPFSTMDSPNAWHDQLRSIRYDSIMADWLLYTSTGFYSLANLNDTPKAELVQPDVSVMGINVQQQINYKQHTQWLIGSFSGMVIWNRKQHSIIDYFTHQPPTTLKGIPISKHPIAGYSQDIGNAPIVFDYNKGTNYINMPQSMATLPMSLRHLCIEIHTGRIYTVFGKANIFFIFIAGLLIIWCLWSGWKIRVKTKKTKQSKNNGNNTKSKQQTTSMG